MLCFLFPDLCFLWAKEEATSLLLRGVGRGWGKHVLTYSIVCQFFTFHGPVDRSPRVRWISHLPFFSFSGLQLHVEGEWGLGDLGLSPRDSAQAYALRSSSVIHVDRWTNGHKASVNSRPWAGSLSLGTGRGNSGRVLFPDTSALGWAEVPQLAARAAQQVGPSEPPAHWRVARQASSQAQTALLTGNLWQLTFWVAVALNPSVQWYSSCACLAPVDIVLSQWQSQGGSGRGPAPKTLTIQLESAARINNTKPSDTGRWFCVYRNTWGA